jgi:hypothetical protein
MLICVPLWRWSRLQWSWGVVSCSRRESLPLRLLPVMGLLRTGDRTVMARTPLIRTMDRPPEIVVGREVHHRFRRDRDFGLGISMEGLMASMLLTQAAAGRFVVVLQIFNVAQTIVVGQTGQAESVMGATTRDLLAQQVLHDAMVRAVPFTVGLSAAGSP